jgi:uncharacterized cupredoxin-like copper-binding protein
MMRGFGGHHMRDRWTGPGVRGSALPPVAGARTIEIVATDFVFKPSEITVKAGEVVNLSLVNQGTTVHDLLIPGHGLHLMAPPGQTAVSGFKPVRPGEYVFLCGIPGHREAGMFGRIVVTP